MEILANMLVALLIWMLVLLVYVDEITELYQSNFKGLVDDGIWMIRLLLALIYLTLFGLTYVLGYPYG